jgi:hypothetical protein
MSFRTLAFSFRIDDTTVGRIVKETVEILWKELHPLHMPLPTTESLKTTQGGFPLRPKTLEICFLCKWNNIPYDIIRK